MATLLRRFWFPGQGCWGVGVTAFTKEEASALAEQTAARLGWRLAGGVVEDVDVRTLDQQHVIPNMGACSDAGVWFPAL